MRLSKILAIAFVVGCGSAEEPPSTEAEPAEVGDEAVALEEPAAPEPAPEELDDDVEPEALGVEAVEPEVVEPEAESEGVQIGHDAVEPAPRVHRRPRSGGPSGGARGAPAPAQSRAPGGDSVYDIEE